MKISKIYQGDCLEVLRTLPDNSVDSVVTDPPYGLSFMGKKWDYDVPSTEIWEECLRVLKPGGYLLAFAGTRTQHRMAVRIEDAGFEIRDMIAWVYSTGFPKSLNIGKSIDSKLTTGSAAKNGFHKLEGERREGRIGMYDTVEEQGFRKNNPEQLGAFNHKPTTAEAKEWEGWGTALKPALEPITVARKPIEGTVAENVLTYGTGGINIDESRVEVGEEEKEGFAKEWDRFQSEAKDGQVAYVKQDKEYDLNQNRPTGRFPANLIHDGSDEVVELFPDSKSGNGKSSTYEKAGGQWGKGKQIRNADFGDSGSASRFFKQCNFSQEDLCLQNQSQNNVKCAEIDLNYQDKLTVQEPVKIKSLDFKNEELPASQDSTGNLKNFSQMQSHVSSVENQESTDTTQITQNSTRSSGCVHLATEENTKQENLNFDNGQVQGMRFLYQAKASKKERNLGCEELEEKTAGECTDRKDGSAGLNSPRAGAGRTSGSKNNHPTVKPIALMEYLVKLVSRDGATVLDPFAGSGTTGIACKNLNRQFIGIEREEEYVKIARSRIENTKLPPQPLL